MAIGKVVRFDEVRGYGFVSPANGGDDVFLHVNDLDVDKSLIAPGITVEFDILDGERGLKAAGVRLAKGVAEAPPPVRSDVQGPVEDSLCDVLSAGEYTEELTETLLRTPSITAEQILQIRRHMLEVAVKHGWVET